MIRLSRETRFALVPPGEADTGQHKNSWAGWPATDLIAPQLRLQLIIAGTADVQTGYLCNIKVIDEMFRDIVINDLAASDTQPMSAETMLNITWQRTLERWPSYVNGPTAFAATPTPTIQSLHLHQSPYLSYARHANAASHSQVKTMTQSTLTHQFEFSAAHRLHCDHLSDEQNRELFSKCNNPAGHGHNYVVEVSISQNPADQTLPIGLAQVIETVNKLVIDKLDHKHLNVDIEYFATVNPTVENISTAIFGWLDGRFDAAQLQSVKVFETPKTWAECCRTM